jgi:hypothetical protein
MPKSSIKYWQTKFNSILERSYTMASQGCRDISKSSDETRNRKNVPHNNKGYI